MCLTLNLDSCNCTLKLFSCILCSDVSYRYSFAVHNLVCSWDLKIICLQRRRKHVTNKRFLITVPLFLLMYFPAVLTPAFR